LQNGTYYEHYIEEDFSPVLTSYSGTFRIEVPYENLAVDNCIPSANYEFLLESYTCSGKSLLSSNECKHEPFRVGPKCLYTTFAKANGNVGYNNFTTYY